jgi:hypothetical protein
MYDTCLLGMRLGSFVYKNKVYQSGTQILYNGPCILNGDYIFLKNTIVKFMYYQETYAYFNDNNNVYMCPDLKFEDNIVQIVNVENNASSTSNKNKEIYWTDSMVAKTIWYILIMALFTIFHGRIFLWILATVVWYNSTFVNE